jgi:hypothetical protein
MLPLFKLQTNRKEPSAGPDLDRQIARVLGLDPSANVPPYSTDDAISVALAEWFSKEWSWWHYKKRELYGSWTVGWIEEKQPLQRSTRRVESSAPTRALAICRSILKVSELIQDRLDGRARQRGLPPQLRA